MKKLRKAVTKVKMANILSKSVRERKSKAKKKRKQNKRINKTMVYRNSMRNEDYITKKKKRNRKKYAQLFKSRSETFKTITKSNPLEAVPSEVIFKDIQVEYTYEISIMVRCFSIKPKFIRFKNPKNRCFKCVYNLEDQKAAGTPIKVTFYFECRENKDLKDEFKIVNEDGFSLTVPIYAYRSKAVVVFEPFINLGFVSVNGKKTVQIHFMNEGTAPDYLHLGIERLKGLISITPSDFEILPGAEKNVDLEYTPKEPGIFRAVLHIDGQHELINDDIEITATSVSHFQFLIDKNGKQTELISFGRQYFGDHQERTYTLINNSPLHHTFQIGIEKAFESEKEQKAQIMTPHIFGLEQENQMIVCNPSKGVIQPYQQLTIAISIRLVMEKSFQQFSKNYAISTPEEDSLFKPPKQEMSGYIHMLIFKFNEVKTPLLVEVSAYGYCPRIKIFSNFNKKLKNNVIFGECPTNDHREIIMFLENKDEEIPIDVEFTWVSQFRITPKAFKIQAKEVREFTVQFLPQNFGNFKSTVYALLLQKRYKIPIHLQGSSLTIGEKKKGHLKGPFAVESDFEMGYHRPDNKDYLRKYLLNGRKQSTVFKSVDSLRGIRNLESLDTTKFGNKNTSDYIKKKIGHEKYNKWLVKSRYHRAKNIKQRILNKKIKKLEFIMKQQKTQHLRKPELAAGAPPIEDLIFEDEEYEAKNPKDHAFWFKPEIGLDPPKYRLPKMKSKLFVLKSIANYEPYYLQEGGHNFMVDEKKIFHEKFTDIPKSKTELQKIRRQLTGKELKNVFVYPTQMDFGSMVICSQETRSFIVQNATDLPIKVQMVINDKELEKSYSKAQIIPSQKMTGFDIVFSTQDTNLFTAEVNYVINGNHEFHFHLQAKITLVEIFISTDELDFKFEDTNNRMSTDKKIIMENKGNADAHFFFSIQKKSVFSYVSKHDFVPSYSKIEAVFRYTPQHRITLKPDQLSVTLKVENGEDKTILFTAPAQDSNISSSCSYLTFGEIPIGSRHKKTLMIRNNRKSAAVVSVDEKQGPGHTSYFPQAMRIGAMDQKEMIVSFQCNDNMNESESTPIRIYVRGGSPLLIPFFAQTKIPEVLIIEDEFDFGMMKYGNRKDLPFTLRNKSKIEAQIIIDLRSQNEFDELLCIDLTNIKKDNDPENAVVSLMKHPDEVDEERREMQRLNTTGVELDEMDEQESQDEESEDNQENGKVKFITLNPKSKLYFNLTFTPQQIRDYEFPLPIQIKGVQDKSSIDRMIRCMATEKPTITFTPSMLQFKEIILSRSSDQAKDCIPIKVKNQGNIKLFWEIKTDDMLRNDFWIFKIEPSQGTLKGGDKIWIKAWFTPSEVSQYEIKVPVFLNKDYEESSVDLILKGKSSNPRILFDRKQVILPIVPLNFVTKTTFKLLNRGYDNLKLRYRLNNQLDSIPLKVKFPNGLKMGVFQQKIKVDVSFKSSRPLSFTKILTFYDQYDVPYQILISGTTDNSLLTLGCFFQRWDFNMYEVQCEENGPLMIYDKDTFDDENDLDNQDDLRNFDDGASEVKSVITNRSVSELLGYTPIKMDKLEQSNYYIKKWMNFHIPTLKLERFPEDVIEKNGTQLFEFLTFLLGSPTKQYNFNPQDKRSEKIQKLYQQYESLITEHKKYGALLNTIRPEFLFNLSDYNAYCKGLNEKECLVNYKYMKMNFTQHQYISYDSWITLFYQIIKIYYLNRVETDDLTTIPGYTKSQMKIDEHYLKGSNIISRNEGILMQWFEMSYNILPVNQQQDEPKRMNNFEELQDGIIFGSLFQNFVGNYTSVRSHLKNMLSVCQTVHDIKTNISKILEAFNAIKVQLPFDDIEDFCRKGIDRPMIMLGCMVYLQLPNYLPKSTIKFSCILEESVTKNIELKNPTRHAIQYKVFREGHSDFQFEQKKILVDARKTYSFPVTFNSRISQKVRAKIIFANHKEEGTQSAAVIVFNLESDIQGRIPIMIEDKITTELYQNYEYKLELKNFWNESAVFDMKIISKDEEDINKEIKEEKQRQQLMKKLQAQRMQYQKENKNLRKKGKGKGKKKDSFNPDAEIEAIMRKKREKDDGPNWKKFKFNAFFYKKSKDQVYIKVNKTQTVKINFLPMRLGRYECIIVISNQLVGEKEYRINAEAILPAPIQAGKQITTLEHSDPIKIAIPFINDQMLEAERQHIQILKHLKKDLDKWKQCQESYKSEEIPLKKTYICSAQTRYLTYNQRMSLHSSPADINKLEQRIGPKTVQSISDVASAVLAQAGGGVSKIRQLKRVDVRNLLVFGSVFKRAFTSYKTQVMLKSKDEKDVRIYEMDINVQPRPIKAIIQFKTAALTTVTQTIPIVNSQSRDITADQKLEVHGDPKHQHWFEGYTVNNKFPILKNSTVDYPIKFSPTWVGTLNATLTIDIQATGDLLVYDLQGISTQPLANKHYTFECNCNELKQLEIEIENPYTYQIAYRVETDIPNFYGPERFELKKKTFTYKCQVRPKVSGDYLGALTFFEEKKNEKYQWITIQLKIKRSKAKKIIRMQTVQRDAVAFEIELKNPMDYELTFEVEYIGQYLFGAQRITIDANSTEVYKLLFAPLLAFEGKGYVTFINQELGEMWYDICLIAYKQPAHNLDIIRSEIGKKQIKQIQIRNPSNQPLSLEYSTSNPKNFMIEQGQDIVLRPYERKPLRLIYIPSDVNVKQNAEILFKSENIGDWKYMAQGIGIYPDKYAEKIIKSQINEEYVGQIQFKNPFDKKIKIKVLFNKDTKDKSKKSKKSPLSKKKKEKAQQGVLKNINEDVFELLLKKESNIIAGKGVIQIPFKFKPKLISTYHAELIIKKDSALKWTFPLKGITEAINDQIIETLQTKCRKGVKKRVTFALPGLNRFNRNEEYAIALVDTHQNFTNIKNWFKIRTKQKRVRGQQGLFNCQVSFLPMKPLRENVQVCITNQSGGVWKFTIKLVGLLPDVDDMIYIRAPINQTRSIQFKLTNRNRSYADFVANFTSDSDPEFTVQPRKGTLSPFGTDGTTFQVSFTPIAYGKDRIGKLFIYTKEMIWTYQIIGKFPKLKVLTGEVEQVVDDKWRMSRSTDLKIIKARQHRSRRIIQDNIRDVVDTRSMSLKSRRSLSLQRTKMKRTQFKIDPMTK